MSFTRRTINRKKKTDLRHQALKVQGRKPVIRNVDIEAIKAQFAANLVADNIEKAAPKAKKETVEVKATEVAE